MLSSVLFIFSLFLILCLLLPVQLYGSLCDQSLNLTNCDERSSSSSTSDTTTIDNSRPDNTETPLIIPDISSKDLDDAMTDGDLGTTDTDVNNDNDDSENSREENSDGDRDSSDSEGRSSDNEPSLIPFQSVELSRPKFR